MIEQGSIIEHPSRDPKVVCSIPPTSVGFCPSDIPRLVARFADVSVHCAVHTFIHLDWSCTPVSE